MSFALSTVALLGAVTAPVPAPLEPRSGSGTTSPGSATVDLPFNAALAAVSCPVERGPVKNGSDADRYKVNTTLTAASIYYLGSRPTPSSYPKNNRIGPTELRTWTLNNVYLTQYKMESDGDLHLVVKDSAGHQMIAEMPYGACVPTTSRWRGAIATARSTFTHALPTTSSWHYTRRLIDLHGLALFDAPHGQTGAARNGIELHPTTYVRLHCAVSQLTQRCPKRPLETMRSPVHDVAMRPCSYAVARPQAPVPNDRKVAAAVVSTT